MILYDLYRLVNFGNIPSNGPGDNMQTNTFWLTFDALSLAVTLKIKSRPSIQQRYSAFIMSKCYIHANLVKIRHLVHEILYTQASLGSNLVV